VSCCCVWYTVYVCVCVKHVSVCVLLLCRVHSACACACVCVCVCVCAHTAYNTQQHHMHRLLTGFLPHPISSRCHIIRCNTLQQTATHCSKLQHTATNCNTRNRQRANHQCDSPFQQKKLLGMQRVSNPSTENQRISIPVHSNWQKLESTLVRS